MKEFWKHKNIELRKYMMSDAKSLYEAQKESEAVRVYEPGIYPLNALEEYEKYIEKKMKDPFAFAVMDEENNFVATANITGVDERNGTFNFSIRVFREYRQKGYGKAAFELLLKYGFMECRFNKANSITIASNEASIKLHLSLGFEIEGRKKENVFTDGQYFDEVLFGMTKNMYLSKKN